MHSLCACIMAALLGAVPVLPTAGVVTHADGRRPIESLYKSYAGLVKRGWTLEIVAQSQPTGTTQALPIIALRFPAINPLIKIINIVALLLVPLL